MFWEKDPEKVHGLFFLHGVDLAFYVEYHHKWDTNFAKANEGSTLKITFRVSKIVTWILNVDEVSNEQNKVHFDHTSIAQKIEWFDEKIILFDLLVIKEW